MREAFTKELDNIRNEDWRKQALELIPLLPSYFWTAPASASGKYHPICDLGEGGIVRHSIMVERIALDLFNAEVFKVPYPHDDENLIDDIHDIVVIAALFHDCLKQGDGSQNCTVFNHPILAANFLKEHLDLGDWNSTLYNAVARHMGKWTTSKYDTETVLERPESQLELLVHTADMISSQKYIGGLTEWGFITDPRQ